ncbi:YidB family protein [Methylobacterium flocculans]|uniref:YidB family protein n=1 Tax=Methylobacterium flocculans TaxID=2984843 RepID=UPI0021F2FAA4|nr:YidB family protein [Methylobacterium sp. FF17]
MSDGFPSMTALLGLLALAGYQNKDKLAELLGGAGQGSPQLAGSGAAPGSLTGSGEGAGGALGGFLGGLAGTQRGASPGGFLSSGLGEMLERFHNAGHGQAAQSWVNHGPNQEIAPHHLEQAIGPDVLATLTQRTGLSRDELLARLSKNLPNAVDQYTPDGRLPA